MTDEEIIRTINEIRNRYLNLYVCLESAKPDPYMYYIDALGQSVKNVQTITKLKSEMKSMKTQLRGTNNDFATGYISAISTLEGIWLCWRTEVAKMRPIDADLLIDELEKMIRTPRSTMEIVRDIIPMVEEQPTAYDVDKVVNELKQCKEIMENPYIQEDCFKRGACEVPDCMVCCFSEAIKIVKRGWIE